MKKSVIMALVCALLIGAVWAGAALKQMGDYYQLMLDHPIIWDEERTGGGPVETISYSYPMPQDELSLELYYDSLEYLACCVQAEAGNQGYKGKRLVARVVLNRVESQLFPDDIVSVINAAHQFEVVSNGHIYTAVPDKETYRAVRDELESCTDGRILFFTAGRYNGSGTPLFRYKGHYFSGK